MKWLLSLSLGVLSLPLLAQTPSDIKRTKIDLDSGEVDIMRYFMKGSLGAGSAKSSATPKSYEFKNIKINVGTKLIAGNVDDTGSAGFAIAPDLHLNLRLDASGKKVRLEVGGKLISLYDAQILFNDNKMKTEKREELEKSLKKSKELLALYEKEATALNKKIALLKKQQASKLSDEVLYANKLYVPEGINKEEFYLYPESLERQNNYDRVNCLKYSGADKEYCLHQFKQSYLKLIKEQFDSKILNFENQKVTLESQMKNEQANVSSIEERLTLDSQKVTHATFDISLVNLGAEHKDIADALYRYTGFKGGVISMSFDVAGKSGKTNVGACGEFDLGTIEAGKYKTKVGEEVRGNFGFSGSVCGKVGYGPVLLTNTFTAKTNGVLADPTNRVSIDNTARLSFVSKSSTSSLSSFELGAYHTYNYEVIGGNVVQGNTVGLGVNALGK